MPTVDVRITSMYPPGEVGLVTMGHAVDSSAIMRMSGFRENAASFRCRRKSTASRFS